MKIAIFTGAGMSEESGVPTFRTGENSIWDKYDPEIYCNVKSWPYHREKMLNFGNELRQSIEKCQPNKGHFDLAKLEEKYTVDIITTNVDNLHEKAGSTNVIHIHGNMFEQMDEYGNHIFPANQDIKPGDHHPVTGEQLRYNIVMFGEMPKYLNQASKLITEADTLIVIGTSLNVYPAAGLVLGSACSRKYYIDPSNSNIKGFTTIGKKAIEGIEEVIQYL